MGDQVTPQNDIQCWHSSSGAANAKSPAVVAELALGPRELSKNRCPATGPRASPIDCGSCHCGLRSNRGEAEWVLAGTEPAPAATLRFTCQDLGNAAARLRMRPNSRTRRAKISYPGQSVAESAVKGAEYYRSYHHSTAAPSNRAIPNTSPSTPAEIPCSSPYARSFRPLGQPHQTVHQP